MFYNLGFVELSDSLFAVSSYFVTLLCFIILLYNFLYKKYMFCKPSMIVLGYFHIFFQLPSAAYSSFLEGLLSNEWEFFIIFHLFILFGLLLTQFTFVKSANMVWGKIVNCDEEASNADHTKFYLGFIFLVSTFVLIVYLNEVPFKSTGLYATMTNPIAQSLARERSLKLLNNPFVAFSITFYMTLFAPLFFSLITFLVLQSNKVVTRTNKLLLLIVAPLILFIALLPGTKSVAVNVIFASFLVVLWINKFEFKLKYILVVMPIIIIPSAILSLANEGNDFTQLFNLILPYVGNVLDRIFLKSLSVGVWFVDYKANYGALGLAGIPKLAYVFGIESLDAPNMVGVSHGPVWAYSRIGRTVSATAGFPFAQFLYFGVPSFFLSLICLLVLDFGVLVLKKLEYSLLIPTLATISVACLMFIQSDYTVVLLSHGFLGILLVAYLMNDILLRQKIK